LNVSERGRISSSEFDPGVAGCWCAEFTKKSGSGPTLSSLMKRGKRERERERERERRKEGRLVYTQPP
jgi:hypothetical protein